MQISGMNAGYSQMTGMAQGGGRRPSFDDKFGSVDSDGDGGVSFDEFTADFEAMKAKRPQDGNAPEMPEMSEEKLEELFSAADADGDGVLSSDEFKSHLESMRPDPGVMQGMMGQMGGNQAKDTDEILLEMMETVNGDDDSQGSTSTSNYLSQVLQQAYGVNSSSSSTSVNSLISVSA